MLALPEKERKISVDLSHAPTRVRRKTALVFPPSWQEEVRAETWMAGFSSKEGGRHKSEKPRISIGWEIKVPSGVGEICSKVKRPAPYNLQSLPNAKMWSAPAVAPIQ